MCLACWLPTAANLYGVYVVQRMLTPFPRLCRLSLTLPEAVSSLQRSVGVCSLLAVTLFALAYHCCWVRLSQPLYLFLQSVAKTQRD
jgi:hypothetical protein